MKPEPCETVIDNMRSFAPRTSDADRLALVISDLTDARHHVLRIGLVEWRTEADLLHAIDAGLLAARRLARLEAQS